MMISLPQVLPKTSIFGNFLSVLAEPEHGDKSHSEYFCVHDSSYSTSVNMEETKNKVGFQPSRRQSGS